MNNTQAFFELLRAGLWEKECQLSIFWDIDFKDIHRLAQEQSVVGLVAAGLEHVKDVTLPKEDSLAFVGETLQLEQRNTAMNSFIEVLINKMRKADIYTLLVKGQGVAQCYERPLWRTCGDVDLFLSLGNYKKAKVFLTSLATSIDEEDNERQHLAMTIDHWVVELHGKMLCGVSKQADNGLEEVKKSLFEEGSVRSWMNGKTQVFLPSADNDVIIVFTHILQHFFYEGIGLRQICDWCRLLWTYRKTIDNSLLEKRIESMGLMTEWKVFAALAVNTLGMPVDAMPLYNSSRKWSRKAKKVLSFILETGNFGHNRDVSYKKRYPFVIKYAISFWMYTKLAMKRFIVFPKDAALSWWTIVKMGAVAAGKASGLGLFVRQKGNTYGQGE